MTLLPRLAGAVCALGVTIAVVGARDAQEIERATTPRLVREFKPHLRWRWKAAAPFGNTFVTVCERRAGVTSQNLSRSFL